MSKIILSKVNFIKAIFTNISIYELHKLLSSLTTSNISILILNKALIDLTEDDSADASGAVTFTIIGQTNYKKIKEKDINKSIKQEKQKSKVKWQKKNTSISISEQKKLISKIITITPNISKKDKLIIAEMQKQKAKINQVKQADKKEKTTTKTEKQTVKTSSKAKTIQNQSVNTKAMPAEIYISKAEKTKENTDQITTIKIDSSPQIKVNQTQSKAPRYSLQKKSSSGLVALFSAACVSAILGLGIGFAGIVGHKKSFSNMLIASSFAVVSYGILAHNTKTNHQSKQLIKKL